MARPLKQGLDYFPLDVDMSEDSAVAFIESRHGLAGFAVVVKLLSRIYRDRGYYLTWTAIEAQTFARMVGLDTATVEAIVDDCLESGLFSRRLFATYRVLSSTGIQTRYQQASRRRKDVFHRPELVLITDGINEEFVSTETGLSETETPLVSTETQLLPSESTQSKGKEIKEEKRETHHYSLPQCLSTATEGVTNWVAPDGSKHPTPAGAFWSAVEQHSGRLVSDRDRRVFCGQIAETCPAGCTHSEDEIDACLEVLLRAVEKSGGKPSPLFRKIVEEDR